MSKFAITLRKLRASANLSREELADRAGLARQTIHDLECGRLRSGKRVAVSPSWSAVQAIASALDVPTDTFRDR